MDDRASSCECLEAQDMPRSERILMGLRIYFSPQCQRCSRKGPVCPPLEEPQERLET